MPSLALGCTSCTAWASTCAAEWRRTARPSSESMVTGSTASPSDSTCARSRSSPPTRATTTALSPANRSPAVVPAATDRSLPAMTTVMSADTMSSLGWGCACRPVGRWRHVTSGDVLTMLSARSGRGRSSFARADGEQHVTHPDGARGDHVGIDPGAAGRLAGHVDLGLADAQALPHAGLEQRRGRGHDEVGAGVGGDVLLHRDQVQGGLRAPVPGQALGLDLDVLEHLAGRALDRVDPDLGDVGRQLGAHAPRLVAPSRRGTPIRAPRGAPAPAPSPGRPRRGALAGSSAQHDSAARPPRSGWTLGQAGTRRRDMASEKDTLFVIAAAYDDVDAAVADYEAVKEIYHEVKTSHDFDAAVVAKDDDGKVKIVKKHEQPTRHGAAVGLGWGLAVGVTAALFPPVGIGLATAGAGGAAIGAVAGHASGGMSRGDLKELGETLDAGQAGLIVVYETNLADQVAANIKAANRVISKATDMAADQLAEDMRRAEQAAPAAQQAATPQATTPAQSTTTT